MDLYTTTDLYLTAYLKTKGFKYTISREGSRTKFVFENSVELLKCIDEYLTENGSCEPLSFTNAIKNIKTLLHNKKN